MEGNNIADIFHGCTTHSKKSNQTHIISKKCIKPATMVNTMVVFRNKSEWAIASCFGEWLYYVLPYIHGTHCRKTVN